MQLTTLKKLIFDKNIFAFLKLGKHVDTMYRTSFVTAANSSGVLDFLNQGGKTLEQLQQLLTVDESKKGALSAWLNCGVTLKELSLRDGKYQLKGKLSKHLAKDDNQIAAALFEEAIRYHYDALLSAPQRFCGGQAYQLADQDGQVIAKSSRILEPFVEEAIDWALKTKPTPQSILEVGCGAGQYLVYLRQRLPDSDILAIDYQQDVAEQARQRLKASNILDIAVEHRSFFDLQGEAQFDLITLHNNIYYFNEAEREQVCALALQLLKPGGKLLLTTSCQGGHECHQRAQFMV